MKPKRGQIGALVDRPDAATRFYLFWGPDEGQSRSYAMRLIQALGADRFIAISGAIKSDPAALVDEAGALSLFGGRRVIWIEPAGDEIKDGVAGLLEAAIVESPVVAIAPASARPKELIRMAETSPLAVAFASYAPEGADAERLVIEIGRRFGLSIRGAVAARIAEASGNDQAVITQEIEKIALYLDASTSRPQALEAEALDAIGAGRDEADLLQLPDLALAGTLAELAEALARLNSGSDAIAVVRALQRRLLTLAPARAAVEGGKRPDAVMASLGKSLFWKDKDKVSAMLPKWTAADLERLAGRVSELERGLLFSDAPELAALGEELLAVARAARRR